MTRDSDYELQMSGTRPSSQTADPRYGPLRFKLFSRASLLRLIITLATLLLLTFDQSLGNDLTYSTYLGGDSGDESTALAIGSDGSIYIVGVSSSTNFPTQSPLQGNMGGAYDGFVLKLGPGGTNLEFSTYLGGSARESVSGIALDTNDNVYVTGWTDSPDFPTTNAYQSVFGGKDAWGDAFAAKISADGTMLEYSTYIGGDRDDFGNRIVVDTNGSAYIVGEAESTNFPVTADAYQMALNGEGVDGMLTVLTPDGTGLVYSTYFGSTNWDSGRAIAIDSSNAIYIAGLTTPANTFPITNAAQPVFGGGGVDGWYAKLSVGGTNLEFSSYWGGSSNENLSGIAWDTSGIYIAGDTGSSDLPTTNAFQAAHSGENDAFVTKFDLNGSNLLYSTFLGGTGNETIHAMDLHTNGSVLIIGQVDSTDYPTTNAFQGSLAGSLDALVAQVGTGGSNLLLSTYMGGTSNDMGFAVKSGGDSLIYLSGSTDSSDLPTISPYQGIRGGGTNDAFAAKIEFTTNSYVRFASSTSTGLESTTNVAITVNMTSTNASTVTVQYAVTAGTASNGVDYSLPAGMLTFLAGETSHVINLVIVDDAIPEFSETVVITLTDPTNGLLGSAISHTYSIEAYEVDIYDPDDDAPSSSLFPVGGEQLHTFDEASDVDWTRFYAISNFTYTIETFDVSINIDTIVDLFQEQPGGSLLNIGTVDDAGFGGGETTNLVTPPDGLYYIRVTPKTGGGKPATKRTRGTRGGGFQSGSYGLRTDYNAPANQLIVLAFDILTWKALPLTATVSLDGAPPVSFNGNTWHTFFGVSTGIHVVEVSCGTPGYVEVDNPDFPNQITNASDFFYGNPRNVEIFADKHSISNYAGFSYVPIVAPTAIVRDAWTQARIKDARIVFDAIDGNVVTNGHVIDGSPYYATYKSNWFTRVDGSFPTSTLVPATNCHLTLFSAGYSNTVVSNAIADVTAGDTPDLGTIYIVPLDTNGNGLADSWEEEHFGTGTNVPPQEDPDGDGSNNSEEYFLGTDPNDSNDVLQLNQLQGTNGMVTVIWSPLANGRSYRPEYCDGVGEDNWQPGGGPWETSMGQSNMQWTDTAVTGQNGRCYRVRLAPP